MKDIEKYLEELYKLEHHAQQLIQAVIGDTMIDEVDRNQLVWKFIAIRENIKEKALMIDNRIKYEFWPEEDI